jgi:hypothetical protein
MPLRITVKKEASEDVETLGCKNVVKPKPQKDFKKGAQKSWPIFFLFSKF